jgi:hypothetical protein
LTLLPSIHTSNWPLRISLRLLTALAAEKYEAALGKHSLGEKKGQERMALPVDMKGLTSCGGD